MACADPASVARFVHRLRAIQVEYQDMDGDAWAEGLPWVRARMFPNACAVLLAVFVEAPLREQTVVKASVLPSVLAAMKPSVAKLAVDGRVQALVRDILDVAPVAVLHQRTLALFADSLDAHARTRRRLASMATTSSGGCPCPCGTLGRLLRMHTLDPESLLEAINPVYAALEPAEADARCKPLIHRARSFWCLDVGMPVMDPAAFARLVLVPAASGEKTRTSVWWEFGVAVAQDHLLGVRGLEASSTLPVAMGAASTSLPMRSHPASGMVVLVPKGMAICPGQYAPRSGWSMFEFLSSLAMVTSLPSGKTWGPNELRDVDDVLEQWVHDSAVHVANASLMVVDTWVPVELVWSCGARVAPASAAPAPVLPAAPVLCLLPNGDTWVRLDCLKPPPVLCHSHTPPPHNKTFDIEWVVEGDADGQPHTASSVDRMIQVLAGFFTAVAPATTYLNPDIQALQDRTTVPLAISLHRDTYEALIMAASDEGTAFALATSLAPKYLWHLAALRYHCNRFSAVQQVVAQAAQAVLEHIPGPMFPLRCQVDAHVLWGLKPRTFLHGAWFVEVPMQVRGLQVDLSGVRGSVDLCRTFLWASAGLACVGPACMLPPCVRSPVLARLQLLWNGTEDVLRNPVTRGNVALVARAAGVRVPDDDSVDSVDSGRWRTALGLPETRVGLRGAPSGTTWPLDDVRRIDMDQALARAQGRDMHDAAMAARAALLGAGHDAAVDLLFADAACVRAVTQYWCRIHGLMSVSDVAAGLAYVALAASPP